MAERTMAAAARRPRLPPLAPLGDTTDAATPPAAPAGPVGAAPTSQPPEPAAPPRRPAGALSSPLLEGIVASAPTPDTPRRPATDAQVSSPRAPTRTEGSTRTRRARAPGARWLVIAGAIGAVAVAAVAVAGWRFGHAPAGANPGAAAPAGSNFDAYLQSIPPGEAVIT